MKIELKEIPLLGYIDPKYPCQRRMTYEELRRKDISLKRQYLVLYQDIWLIGRFFMQWYGWLFRPNLGSMVMNINNLSRIYQIKGLSQKKSGSIADFIASYLPKNKELEEEEA